MTDSPASARKTAGLVEIFGKAMLLVTGMIAGLYVVVWLLGLWSSGDVERAQARADASMLAATQAAADVGVALDPPDAAAPWEYREQRHELSGRPIRQACTLSTNTIRLDWPYQSQQLRLCIQHHPRHGQTAIISLPRGGQFMCRYDGCTVQVRMGEDAPSGFTAVQPSDGSTQALFISNHSRFLRGLRRARGVAIEATYYQAGTQTATFNTANLEWDLPTPEHRSPRSTPAPPPQAPQEKDPETAAEQFSAWLEAQPEAP